MRPACSQNRARWYIICRIRLPASNSVPFFQKRHAPSLQNRPGSDLDDLVRFWPNASGLEAGWCAGIIGSDFWQETTGPLPVSHFQTRLRSSTDVPDHNYSAKPARVRFVVADCARFGPSGSGQQVSRCERTIGFASGQCFRADPMHLFCSGCRLLCFTVEIY